MMVIFGGSIPLQAQQNNWNLIFTFDRPIGCGYFFDENHGLLGSGIRIETEQPCAIYKTTDGGQTFTPSVVPTSIPGAVTSISMIDSLNGFASIFSSIEYYVDGTFGRSSLWQTTDGGSTWFDPFHLDHVNTEVYAQHGLIQITNWDASESTPPYPVPDPAGGNYSFDSGVTWEQNTNFRRCNGIAFSDSVNGVVTEMNYTSGGGNFWVTTDAGRTWEPTVSDLYESWSVYAMPGQGIYFCANESQPTLNLPSSSINWSTDGGFTWTPRINFSTMHFTGTIDGVGKTLYFQTDTAIYVGDPISYLRGMYRSDDTGATWHFIGGPTNSRDTRFVVTGCLGQVVYAFDQVGGVYKTINGGDGSLIGSFTLNVDTLGWNPSPCGDSVLFTITGSNCLPITIDSVSLAGTTEFFLPSGDTSLPATLTEGDSTQIQLLYLPTKSGRTVSNVTVFGHSGENVVRKVLTIVTRDTLASGLALSEDTARMSAGACTVAEDTILVSNLACPDMVIDSITFPSGEVSLDATLPAQVPGIGSYPLRFIFQPDSAGFDTLKGNLYAHDGRELYDTTFSIIVQSVPEAEQIVLDSTQLAFSTKYCQPILSSIDLLAFGCDSIVFDSVLFSNGNFTLLHTPSVLAPEIGDSVNIEYAPDSDGTASDSIHIFAHGKWGACDTTIFVSASNFSLPQSATLSQNAITLATVACVALSDTLDLGNLGCGELYLDSVMLGDDSEMSISYDTTQLPLQSGNLLPIHITYSPSNGDAKALTLRLTMHTAQRAFDTTVSVSISNNIPADPLVLSTDSLYLFTKYCQPMTVPIKIGNLGCTAMSLDAVTISGDTLNEFTIPDLADSIYPSQWDSTTVTFTPDSAGSREVLVKIHLHNSGQTFDTTLSIIGKNLIAPSPYIPALPTLAAGQVLNIPIMLEPTADTFSIHSYTFQLSFNTDLLTPTGLGFTNTCSAQVLSSKLTPEPGIGCSGTVTLIDTITNTAQLTLPLVYVTANVSLTLDTTTEVTLDSFTTGAEPALGLCSDPTSPFTLAPACGDPYLVDLLGAQPISFSFVGVAPNPASAGNWDVDYITRTSLPTLTLDIYDAAGTRISHTADLETTIGEHHASIPIPNASGDYFLVLGNGREQTARKGSVAK
jgi:photosystem II stability/assembly factor-like uncharacterized protein